MLHTGVFPHEVRWYSLWHPVMTFTVGLILKM